MEFDPSEGTVNGKATSTWARLIRKIFEVDALQCPICNSEMRVIAFITQYQVTRNILKHIGEETARPPPLKPNVNRITIPESDFGDFIPPIESYFQDPEYPI